MLVREQSPEYGNLSQRGSFPDYLNGSGSLRGNGMDLVSARMGMRCDSLSAVSRNSQGALKKKSTPSSDPKEDDTNLRVRSSDENNDLPPSLFPDSSNNGKSK